MYSNLVSVMCHVTLNSTDSSNIFFSPTYYYIKERVVLEWPVWSRYSEIASCPRMGVSSFISFAFLCIFFCSSSTSLFQFFFQLVHERLVRCFSSFRYKECYDYEFSFLIYTNMMLCCAIKFLWCFSISEFVRWLSLARTLPPSLPLSSELGIYLRFVLTIWSPSDFGGWSHLTYKVLLLLLWEIECLMIFWRM